MPLITVTCVILACDLCRQNFEPDDYTAHFDGANEARVAAETYGWSVTAEDRVICPSGDAEHRQALLPPTRAPGPGQLALVDASPEAGR
ncbi:hypothetical protein OG756_42205 (plasmid) [Streptomyces sp. NBC_01310]|uniref:hypothetical protein n=1 Tax=Streptomyces sp. NBC_01310 TaxID=2903820 RepID=UPI0035B5D9D7|nr:hypothetical protein OG756_42205 [Streptomyces sp. NBC_01310]